ncbi:MAG TPA: hypothetical protein VF989_15835 [Polyangiaceae bacterium]
MTPDERSPEKPASPKEEGPAPSAGAEEKRNTQRLATTETKTTTTQPPDAPSALSSVPPSDSDEHVAEADREFDPGTWGTLEVTSGLRAKMLASKRPRLDQKYFQDTFPPNQSADATAPAPPKQEPRAEAAPRTSEPPGELATAASKKPEAVPSRRFAGLILAVFVVAVALVVALSLLVKAGDEQPALETPHAAPAEAPPLATPPARETAEPVPPREREPAPHEARRAPEAVRAPKLREIERTPVPGSATRSAPVPKGAAPVESTPAVSAKPGKNPNTIDLVFTPND